MTPIKQGRMKLCAYFIGQIVSTGKECDIADTKSSSDPFIFTESI